MKKTLVIVDGHNFLFRAFGMPFAFHSKNGTPLHVVTAFLSLVRRAAAAGEATHIAVVFDTPTKTSNHVLSIDYKANRKKDYDKDEDSPFRHMPHVKKVLSHLKVAVFEKRGTEADDVIASLAAKYLKKHSKGNVRIASTDSDFYQLLSPRLALIHLGNKGSHILFTPESLMEKYAITPKQYILFKSLTGDAADNIKGISGVGPIRASKIVNKMLDFDTREHRDLLILNKKLVTLDSTVRVPETWEKLAIHSRFGALKNQDIFVALKF